MNDGKRELRFYVSKASDVNTRYRGKHIAIVGDKVVASGKNPIEVWRRARKSHPRSTPVLAYAPKDDSLVLASSSDLKSLFLREMTCPTC